eukprot:Sspe_Gene.35466::Locus_17173_Transcript_1_1_Confidence_1.000_Length_997::g.35466::m.35466
MRDKLRGIILVAHRHPVQMTKLRLFLCVVMEEANTWLVHRPREAAAAIAYCSSAVENGKHMCPSFSLSPVDKKEPLPLSTHIPHTRGPHTTPPPPLPVL